METNTAQQFKAASITLRALYAEYQEVRNLSRSTINNCNYRFRSYLADWMDLPVQQITPVMVEQRFKQIPAKMAAKDTFKIVRALINYAQAKYVDADGIAIIKHNPVLRLTQLQAWPKTKRRTRLIQPRHMADWFRAVLDLRDESARDCLITLLLTGMRKSEATQLRWNDVDFGHHNSAANQKR